MTCADFQRVLPEIMESSGDPEHRSHLESCPECSGLISDLNEISHTARLLQASEEPSPRVWNSIESALRQEGLIRRPLPDRSLGPSRRWAIGWLVPIAAALLVGFGLMLHEKNQSQVAEQATMNAPVPSAQLAKNVADDDEQLLDDVTSRSPNMRAEYASNLQTVNAYIRDAEESAKADPNDDDAQQSVRDAYEQRAMVVQMAMDRSLP